MPNAQRQSSPIHNAKLSDHQLVAGLILRWCFALELNPNEIFGRSLGGFRFARESRAAIFVGLWEMGISWDMQLQTMPSFKAEIDRALAKRGRCKPLIPRSTLEFEAAKALQSKHAHTRLA
jgi:hypothetical protein